jgi:hypothetical protein
MLGSARILGVVGLEDRAHGAGANPGDEGISINQHRFGCGPEESRLDQRAGKAILQGKARPGGAQAAIDLAIASVPHAFESISPGRRVWAFPLWMP